MLVRADLTDNRFVSWALHGEITDLPKVLWHIRQRQNVLCIRLATGVPNADPRSRVEHPGKPPATVEATDLSGWSTARSRLGGTSLLARLAN